MTNRETVASNGEKALQDEEDVRIQQGSARFNQVGRGLMVLHLKYAGQLYAVLSGLLSIEVHPSLGRMFSEVREQLQNHLDSWEEWQTARYHEDMVNQLDAQWSEQRR